jgi:hypothetical protein
MAAAGAEGPGEEIRAALQRGRRWSAWALRWPGACPGAVDCAVVEQALREELRGFFQDFAVAAAAAGAAGDRIALRVAITERASARSAQRKTSTVYLVHFLRSDLVLASALKVRRLRQRPLCQEVEARRVGAVQGGRSAHAAHWGLCGGNAAGVHGSCTRSLP